MKPAVNDLYPVFVGTSAQLDWPEHVFPTEKYHLLTRRLQEALGATSAIFAEAEPATDEQLVRVHTQEYLDRLKGYCLQQSDASIAEFEVPFNRVTFDAVRRTTGASIAASQAAVAAGMAMNIGGGFHHAFADHGEGFCILNDIAISIRELQAKHLIRNAAIIDVDVHQGNGTAHIFSQDDSVFTYSIHQQNNYPVKEVSSLDHGLPDDTTDELYLETLKAGVV